MSPSLLSLLTLATALGAGVIGGVFFSFSSFVMRALARLPPAQGIAAMQSINVVVINPVFLGVFLGTTGTSAILVVAGLVTFSERDALWLLAGGLLYVVGTFAVTMAFNVPRNEALAGLDPNGIEATVAWTRYVREWTAWNHVRTTAAIAAAGCLAIALG